MTLKILHKRSTAVTGGVADAPAAADLEYGEIGINYADADPALFIKDTADVIRRINLPTQGNSKYSIANDSTTLVGADATTAINAALVAAGDIASAADLRVSDQCQITDSGNPDFNAQAPIGRYWWDGAEWFQGGGGGASVDIDGTAPDPANQGDLWFDTDCGLLKIYDDTDTWVDVVPVMPTGGLTGDACRERVFYENEQVINHDYTLGAGNNAMSAGPVTIDDGATITIPTDATWSVVGGSDGSPVPSGGVTRLIAGSNITLNPTSGVGDVTVSSTGGDFYAGAAAWANTGNSADLAGGLNIAAVTAVGAGIVRYTFETPMPDSYYAVTAAITETGITTNSAYIRVDDKNPTGFGVKTWYIDNATGNPVYTNYAHSIAVHATNALPPRGGTGADAWATVEEDGTTSGSFNLSSALSGTDYNFTFTNPMPSANYAVVATANIGGADRIVTAQNRTTTGFTLNVRNGNNDLKTDAKISVVVHATNAQLPDTVTQEQLDAVLDNWERDGTTLKPVNIGDDIVGVKDVVVSDALVIKDANDIIISGFVKTVLSQDGGAFIYQHPNQANFNQILQDGTNGNVLFGSASSIYATIDNDTGDYNAVSDVKLKSNINELNAEQTLDKVSKLKPSSYVMRGVSTAGFVAQEVEPLFPNLVGEVTVNGEITKTLNYAGFTAPLVAAVKGLLDKVETLEAKVQQLEGGSN